MRTLHRLASLALIALATVTPASAQDTGSLVRSELGQVPENGDKLTRARQGMLNFAACVAARKPGAVKSYLADTVPYSNEANKVAQRLSKEDCLDGSLVFDEAVFRAASYEALYKTRFGRAQPGDLSALPVVDYAFGTNPIDADGRQSVALRRFADCVTRAAPGEVHSLMLSRPASALEGESMRVLMPRLSGCLVKDITLKFSKVQLRGVLGETLYRIRAGGEAGE